MWQWRRGNRGMGADACGVCQLGQSHWASTRVSCVSIAFVMGECGGVLGQHVLVGFVWAVLEMSISVATGFAHAVDWYGRPHHELQHLGVVCQCHRLSVHTVPFTWLCPYYCN